MCAMVGQLIQKKQEEKQIEEEQAANARCWKIPACCDDDDDYNSAITPNEHVDSLSMGDEHLNTIPATESDEFIKSCVENLVPNLSESEDENGCDVPSCFTTFSNILFDADYDFYSVNDQSLSDEDVPEKIFSNPLFEEEIIPMKIDPHHFNAESDLIESMLNHDSSVIPSSLKIDSLLYEFADELTLLKLIPPGINETDCDPEEDIRLIDRLLYDNSSPRPPEEFVSDNFDANIESFSPSPIPVKDSDSFMKEIDLSFNSDDPMPLGIEEDDYDSERDILIREELLDNYSLSLPVIESCHFDIPSFSRPPTKPPYGNTGILNIKMMGDVSKKRNRFSFVACLFCFVVILVIQHSRKYEDSCHRILSSKSSFPQLQLGIIKKGPDQSSHLLRYANSKPNGKLIYNFIMHGPYVKRMIPKPGDPDREVPIDETFHEQTNGEITNKEEIWLRVQQMMKCSDIGIQDKKAKLFNDWERNQNGYDAVLNVRNQNGNGNVVAAQAEGNDNGNGNRNNRNQVRCYNCRGISHLARNYTVRPQRRDVAYLQTQLLIAQKEEAGIQLQDEEFDLMAAARDLDKIEEVYEQKDTTKGTSENTMFIKQSILRKPPSSSKSKLYSVTPFPNSKVIPKVGGTNALLKPVTSNSKPSTQESKVMKKDNVIALGMFRINHSKTSRVDNFMPNKHVKASVSTKTITASQRHVITKKDVNSNTNGLPSIGVESTAKTKRP
nr:hypothetical protein [Tanacetum cinerariifolium]